MHERGRCAARLDGDDLVLVLEGLREGAGRHAVTNPSVGRRSNRSVRTDKRPTIRTSLGVTLFPHDNSTAQHLVRHADQALCTFKESRGERQFPLENLSTGSRRAKTDPAEACSLAVSQWTRGSPLSASDQSANRMRPGRGGVGSTCRATDNILLPGEFLDCFRPHELTELTLQVLAQSLRDVRHLDQSGLRMNLGINLEPATLADLKAMQNLRHQIETSGMSAKRIVLELLEHPDTLSMTGSREVLLDLKRSGATGGARRHRQRLFFVAANQRIADRRHQAGSKFLERARS